MRSLTFLSFLFLTFITVDIYVFQGVKALTESFTPTTKKVLYILYWSLTVIAIATFLLAFMINFDKWNRVLRLILISVVSVGFFTKLFFLLFLFIDDLQRGVRWVVNKISDLINPQPISAENTISRSDFLLKAGVVAASVPLIGMTWGIVSGAHDYRVRRKKVGIKNLPKEFHGFKIVQISDIHSGSFYNKTAVKGGVEMIMKEKGDVVFFTGDMVNDKAVEMKDYVSIFDKIKAPLGVYSTLGNHDYGDYARWNSIEEKRKNLNDLMKVHQQMGWNLLMNENKIITEGGEKLGILGIENWGARGNFPKYGKMNQAYKNLDDVSVKLLLSHDPSHWDAEVREKYNDIDIMFAGHTHGMQFGIDNEVLKWSPVQYVYDQWAGLYQKENQYLYVNRGFGFIGFPGRIGMLPEITVIELEKT